MKDIGFYSAASFIERYCYETRDYVLPIAETVDLDMRTELADLIESRMNFLKLLPLLNAQSLVK
jgi:hypothetical protein